MSSRGSVIEWLKPMLAATEGLEKIKVIESPRAQDQLSSRPVLIVKTDYLEKVAEATRWVQGTFTLVLVSNLLNMEKAEDQLDELLQVLLPALVTPNTTWDRATQTAYDDQHVSYDITLRSILK